MLTELRGSLAAMPMTSSNTAVVARWILGFALSLGLVWAPKISHAQEDEPAADTENTEARTVNRFARRVAEYAGDPNEIDEMAFTFVYAVDGETRLKRRHVWHPGEGRLTVEFEGDSVTLRHLHDYDLTPITERPADHVDVWKQVAPEVDPERAAEAWSAFLNDSYWLLAPSKLFDPGVNRSIDGENRLKLTFGDVGLTPGDTYWLTVDRESGRVTRWSYRLEGGREGTFRWLNYQTFGPLRLSLRRTSTEDGAVIRFEDVEVES